MTDFILLSAALVTAATFGFLARLLKQPALVGFLVAGIILGNLATHFPPDLALFGTFSKLGIALLLFLVGLEMDLKQLSTIGKTAIFVGIVQMLLTFLLGTVVSLFLGLTFTSALFLGLALAFSSTIIAIKLLSEKQDLATLYGKITIGVLLVQDLVVILALILLVGSSAGSLSLSQIFPILVKGVLLFLVIWLVGKKPLPWIFDRIAPYPELLFVTSIAWALGLSALVSLPIIGFSIEIGGFLAGISLATSSEHLQIASRIRPVRDFFLTLFFLSLGMQMRLTQAGSLILPAIALSLVVLIVKPLTIAGLLGALGYRRRTSFLTAVSLSQISEFSFIFVGLAATLGYLANSEVSLVVLIGAITMVISTYLAQNGTQLYAKIRHSLKFLERQHTRESVWRPQVMPEDHILLLGCDRTGRGLLPVLQDKCHPLLIIDSNPKVVGQLMADGFTTAYGDIADLELLEEVNLDKSHMIISTVPDTADNLLILERIRHQAHRPITIMISDHPKTALRLYEAGADYVLIPRLLTGDHLARLLANHDARSFFETLRQKQLRTLQKLSLHF